MTGVVPGRRDRSKSIKVVTGINNTLDMKLHEVIISHNENIRMNGNNNDK